jgi:phosphocarrier protein NPr
MAQSFKATITITNDENLQATADGVMGLLMLDSAQGQYVDVSADGPDAVQALNAICELIEAGFDEDE